MSDNYPPLMGSGATASVIEPYSFERYARELGEDDDAWVAAHLALAHDKAIRFERTGDEAFYVARFDPNIVEQHADALRYGHLKLEELIGSSSAVVAYREQLPALRTYILHFETKPHLLASVAIEATSLEAAQRRVLEDWEQFGPRVAMSAKQRLITSWNPAPHDFRCTHYDVR